MTEVPLGELCDIRIGRTPSRSEARYWGGDAPWLAISDLKSAVVTSTSEGITQAGIDECRCMLIPEGTVVVSFKLTLGKAAILGRPMYTNEAIAALEIKDTANISRPYLFWAIQHAPFSRVSERAVKGATLNTGQLRRLPIAVPNRDEQERIVRAMDGASTLVRKAREGVQGCRALNRSTFIEHFGDPVSNPHRHEVRSIGEICGDADIVDGPFGSSLKPECYVESGVRVIRNANVRENEFDGAEFKYITPDKFREIDRSEVRAGDLLLTIKGTIGRVCVMPELAGPSVLSASGTVRVRLPEKVLPDFVSSQIISSDYQRYLRRFEAGTNQKYLNLSVIRRLEIIIPPLELQQRFVETLTQIRALKSKLTASLAEAEALYRSLSHQFFGA
ncbi:MAG: restriction endonuclease subunit S [Myxococcota bacterium]